MFPPYGCIHDCEYRLDCGHACRLKCHSYDQQHTEYKCLKPCVRSCEFEHPCKKLCSVECGLCEVVVERTLTKCKHTVKMKCHVKEEKFKCENPCKIRCPYDHLCNKLCWQMCSPCMVVVERTLTKCEHTVKMKCHVKEEKFKCENPCKIRCPYDHLCNKLCWQMCSPCMVVVERTLTKCEHTVKMKCHVKEENFKCENPCKIRCSYDHLCNQLCWKKCDPCNVKVVRLLPKCQHMAEMFCHEEPEKFKCQELVEKTLSRCQHTVTMLCHENEKTYHCRQPCSKFCTSNHPCSKLCYEYCGSCDTMVEKTLTKCGHAATIACGMDEILYQCKEPCKKNCKNNHLCQKLCFEDCGYCEIEVEIKLPMCGHMAKMHCYLAKYERSEYIRNLISRPIVRSRFERLISKRYVCTEPCDKTCSRGHPCTAQCGQTCTSCQVLVEQILPTCQHKQIFPCYLPLTEQICTMPCERSCSEGHKCKKKCGDRCGFCDIMMEKELPGCGHTQIIRCYQNLTYVECTAPCEKQLECGHQCKSFCGQWCVARRCIEMVEKTLPCEHVALTECSKGVENYICKTIVNVPCIKGHERKIQCSLRNTRNFCSEICNELLDCGHTCKGKCSQCNSVENHLGLRRAAYRVNNSVEKHVPCQATCCDDCLFCNHHCKTKCAGPQILCIQNCRRWCVHVNCNHKCSEPCTPCSKPCTWQCPHQSCELPCSEPCIRPPCNERCPKKLFCGHFCIGALRRTLSEQMHDL